MVDILNAINTEKERRIRIVMKSFGFGLLSLLVISLIVGLTLFIVGNGMNIDILKYASYVILLIDGGAVLGVIGLGMFVLGED